jgi:hypothetical protein
MMAMKGEMNVRTKIVINNHIIEQAGSFNYLRYTITVTNSRDLEIKINRFNQVCCAIRRTLINKSRKDTQVKFYKVMAVPLLTRGSEIWSITKEKKKT